MTSLGPATERTPLRIAVLGDFDGAHTKAWTSFFAGCGHAVHAISFYEPAQRLDGVSYHVLKSELRNPLVASQPGTSQAEGLSPVRPEGNRRTDKASRPQGVLANALRLMRRQVPPSLERLIQDRRYQAAGLRQVVADIAPDVFHAHFLVEHGFYGLAAGYHTYVVSAWGSDLYRASLSSAGRMILRRVLAKAALVTLNDPAMAAIALDLGTDPGRLLTAPLGLDDEWFAEMHSANEDEAGAPPTVISDRALEPLYNIDTVLRAFEIARAAVPGARLVIAHDGREMEGLKTLATRLGLGDSVRFLGRLSPADLRRELQAAHVYVSVPDSDSFALSTMEAMACGAFPVVSDLASQDGWIADGTNGLLVPAGDVDHLAKALVRALSDATLRRAAVNPNRARVEKDGNRGTNLQAVEARFYELTRHREA